MHLFQHVLHRLCNFKYARVLLTTISVESSHYKSNCNHWNQTYNIMACEAPTEITSDAALLGKFNATNWINEAPRRGISNWNLHRAPQKRRSLMWELVATQILIIWPSLTFHDPRTKDITQHFCVVAFYKNIVSVHNFNQISIELNDLKSI